MSIPAVMIALALLLKPAASRWLNVTMGAAYAAINFYTMIDAWKFGYYYYVYLTVVDVILSLLIVWYSLTWPRQPAENGSGNPGEIKGLTKTHRRRIASTS
jgi:hypothetical protein